MRSQTPKRIVVIGGGTGTYTVLSGLKRYAANGLDLSAVVAVSDSGGSTGRLRDEFGQLPVGDFRMALVALADDSEVSGVLRNLFLHRFDKGEGLKGHNFGNLFLVALSEALGSEERAIEYASRVLRVRGNVLPVATDKLTLAARYASGKEIRGEALIDDPPEGHDGTERIEKIWIEPEAKITPRAEAAIRNADLIVTGPGDLYTSILANMVVSGVSSAIQSAPGKLVYVANLMSKYGQTDGFSVGDHIKEIERYSGRTPDCVVINNMPLPRDVLRAYEEENEFPVFDDLKKNEHFSVVRGDFLAPEQIVKPSGDVLRRSLIRHNSDKLASTLLLL